ncbi:DUF5011 domain-containing protein [bacterium]|nr:DUF5011 domain-containing protein [bacterium]
MKKFYTLFTALFFSLFSFMTYAQGPWNFNGSNDIWESTGTSANLTSGASFSTLDVNNAGNPMLRTFSANINASAVTHAVITLKNNTANKYMRVFYQTTGTSRYVNVGITANDADFVSYYVDMTGNADWTGTVNELTFQFRENSSYSTALGGTIDIDNIEMTSSDLGVNMVNNSSFENWGDDTEATPVDPVGFYKHESVERSSDSHSGDYSIKVIATSTRKLAQTVNEITAGATYRISINYKIEENTGNGVRLWSTWKDASNVSLASSDLQPSGFLNTVSSEWATFSVDAVAPENATKLNFEVRSYGGATVYWDSFSVSKVAEPDPCDGVTGAPAIADDFDGNSVDILEYVGDNDATFATVDGTPFGSTSNVLQYVDNGGQYANIQLRTCNKFDMAVTNFFTMDVYIDGSSLTGAQPNQVAFKLQDQSMGAGAWQSQVEVVVPVTAVDTWQTVEFDFIAASGRTDIDQVVIQFNGENNNDQVIAYIDNLVSSTSPEPDPCDGVTGAPAIADDFDGNSVDILEYVGDNDATFATVDGTPFGSTSNVLQYVDNGGQYANIQLRTCNKFDMAVTNFFTMDVYIDGSSLTGAQPNQVAFKLQDQSMGAGAWQSQVEVVVPVTAVDTWQTVEFDFIAASGRTDIDQVVIQFNGENNNDQVIAYIDNLVSSTSVADTTPPVIVLEGANPQELTVGDAYVELGATATDDTDDDTTLTAAIVIDATAVDTATAGSYSVTYNVSDAAGNAATEVTRTVTVEAATVSGPPCTHTLVMNDQYDDTWNGASVAILVNGTVVASTTGPAYGVADDTLTFDAASGDTIALGNWSSGSYDSEISWELLDGEGSSLGSGGFGDGTAGLTAYCTPPPPCPHTLVMNDQYDDTWNGASVAILVNGTVVASTTGPAYGVADDTLAFDAASGDTIALGNWSSGSYDSEISWAILDGAGTEIAAGGFGDGTTEVTGYCPSCLDPTNLTVSDITTTTASVSWIANNGETAWEYQVVESGDGAGPDATGTATSDIPLALTGLTANTAYDVYVRANCGDGVTSAWVMVSFTTLFQAPSCGETAEYCYASGDGGGSGFASSYTVDPLELVFTSTVDTTGDYLTLTIGGETESGYDWVYVTDGAGNVILEPVSGAMEYDVVSEDGTVNVYISADSSVSCASPSSWSGEPDTPLSFAVSCNPPPSCLDPTDLTVADITQTTAYVTWTANNGETAWEYQVVESGVAPDATGTATSDNPLALTDLTDNTTYDVYVRANCDADGTSEWVTVSFTTPIVPDYMNDFTTFPGEFWSEGSGALNVGPTGSTSSWMEDGFVSGSTGAARINLYGLRDSWLISPMFDLSNGTFFLNVDAAATEYNTQSTDAIFGADDFVTLMASTDGGSTWVELHRWDASNNPGYTGTGWTEITLNNYTATSKFAIYGESTTSAEDVDFFVDNFSITSTSLGLEDVNTSSNFTYFPNPVNNVLSIKAQASIDSITVYNMLGQTVVRSTPNTTTIAVDMSGLQTGAYFVQVAINNSIETVRVIKN